MKIWVNDYCLCRYHDKCNWCRFHSTIKLIPSTCQVCTVYVYYINKKSPYSTVIYKYVCTLYVYACMYVRMYVCPYVCDSIENIHLWCNNPQDHNISNLTIQLSQDILITLSIIFPILNIQANLLLLHII